MPPKSQSQRRVTQSQTESVYELGVQGRKTGLTLAERPRDENGMEAFDDLFSSPEKDVTEARVNGANGRNDAESDEEQEMEIDDESQMGPATIMKQRQSRPSLPRARSPIKTHLQSPARQNPHLGPTSSPTRGSYVAAPERDTPKSVNRRLDFSKSAENRMRPPVNGQPKVNGVKGRNEKLTKGRARASEPVDEEPIVRKKQNQRRHKPQPEPEPEPEEDEEEEQEPEESMQILDAGDDEVDHVDEEEQEERDETPIEPEPEVDDEEPEPEPEPVPESPPIPQPKAAKRRGRKPKSPVAPVEEEEPSEVEPAPVQPAQIEAEDEPVKKRRGRPARSSQSKDEIEPTKTSPKRGRPKRSSGASVEGESQEQEDNEQERETKRQRTGSKENKASSSSKATATTKEKGKPGRRRKSSGVGVDEPVVQRGPPLPRSRGLVINRSEEDVNSMHTTRSGRLSFKPVEFWRGEHPVFDKGGQHVFEDKGGHFVMPTIKGVLRTAEPAVTAPRKRRGRPAGNSKGGPGQSVWARRRARGSDAIIEEEEEIERDEWEFEPGRIAGDCLNWRPEYEGMPVDDDDVEVAEEELAISEAAIQLKDIKDATFRFAKTLTMPFFGSGVVDMPPGSEKRTKNSRKMQMVFFVHQGSVEVTVASTEFRIGKGGMWFVPRGNHYSIANNTERPARIFFAQGCEMVAQEETDE
ncbi:Mif2/CENP-C like-domain-containing protein [Hypoxylon sp. FL1150]|nr:Mif2/CENP-C like-domain-containing protein [Hypoxylon sp. FL1150]